MMVRVENSMNCQLHFFRHKAGRREALWPSVVLAFNPGIQLEDTWAQRLL